MRRDARRLKRTTSTEALGCKTEGGQDETDNTKAALLKHLQEMHTPLLEREPTGFIIELCVSYNRVARQQRLIQEYQPVFNRRLH